MFSFLATDNFTLYALTDGRMGRVSTPSYVSYPYIQVAPALTPIRIGVLTQAPLRRSPPSARALRGRVSHADFPGAQRRALNILTCVCVFTCACADTSFLSLLTAPSSPRSRRAPRHRHDDRVGREYHDRATTILLPGNSTHKLTRIVLMLAVLRD